MGFAGEKVAHLVQDLRFLDREFFQERKQILGQTTQLNKKIKESETKKKTHHRPYATNMRAWPAEVFRVTALSAEELFAAMLAVEEKQVSGVVLKTAAASIYKVAPTLHK